MARLKSCPSRNSQNRPPQNLNAITRPFAKARERTGIPLSLLSQTGQPKPRSSTTRPAEFRNLRCPCGQVAWLKPLDSGYVGRKPLLLLPYLATVTAAVLVRKALLFSVRTGDLPPLSIPQDDLITT